MTSELPTIERIYQNHTLDSTRWKHYEPRPDDIVIATPYKSGTTWMQIIIINLIFQDLQIRPYDDYSPWIDNRTADLTHQLKLLDEQTHRRCIKTHLPLDGLPYYSEAKYIVVNRDARDVCISMWNHHSRYNKDFLTFLNTLPGRVGHPMPRCPEDFRDFWQQWITNGWFEWESEGYPYWSNLRHVQTWFNFRHLPNILFVHFNDLLGNLEGEIQRIADFLDIPIADGLLPEIADAVTFKTIKQNAEKFNPGAGFVWENGANTFFNKGTNGRWRDVLTDEDLELYTAAVERELTPDCAHWLENGRHSEQSVIE